MISRFAKQRNMALMVAGALALASAGAYAAQQDGNSQGENGGHARRVVKHVLLISVDGLHEQDLARCVGANTCPNIAVLAQSGVTYTNAYTPGLSDSFPGLAALVTGGSPKTAGLFYDVSYDRNLYAPGDTTCGTSIYTDTETLSGGSATSGNFTDIGSSGTYKAGTYQWTVSYSGDGNNSQSGPTSCGDTSEQETVTAASTTDAGTNP